MIQLVVSTWAGIRLLLLINTRDKLGHLDRLPGRGASSAGHGAPHKLSGRAHNQALRCLTLCWPPFGTAILPVFITHRPRHKTGLSNLTDNISLPLRPKCNRTVVHIHIAWLHSSRRQSAQLVNKFPAFTEPERLIQWNLYKAELE
jgi:hypothetical protein